MYLISEVMKLKLWSRFSNVESVHKLHYVVVQCQFSSSLMECPHKQEVFQSDLSSASYDSVHYIYRVTRTPSTSPAVKLHTTHTTAVITTASALLIELLSL